jgi:hypothetical protein
MKKTGKLCCIIAEKIARELMAKTSSHAWARRTLRNIFALEMFLTPLLQRFPFKGRYAIDIRFGAACAVDMTARSVDIMNQGQNEKGWKLWNYH